MEREERCPGGDAYAAMEDPASEGLPSELVSAVDAGAFLADVLEHSPVPYALFGLDGHPVFTNPAYRSMFGSAPPPEYNLLTDDLLTRVGLADPVHRAYAGERVQAPVVWYDPTQLTQVPVPAGVRRAAIACTLFPVRNSERRITHVAVAYRDVTAEMDAEARASAATTEAHFSEQRYRLIAEAANDGLWFWNLQNDRVDWNPRLLDLLGLQRPRGESRLHHVLDRVHPDDQPRMRAALEAHLQRRERYELEVRVLHADGGWRVWLCRGQATWGIDGKATFMAGSATDVTEQKRVAEGQQRQTAELREAIQARDTFLSVASHELKTPLTPLALRLAQLTREVGGKGGERIDRSRALRSLEIAAAQVKKLATLVDGLLDVSRLAQGRLALTEDEVDLVEIVRGAAEALRPQAERAGSPLTLDASGRAVGRLDRARVKQVVTHLVSNAIKFGAGLPVEISLSVRAGWATVTVKDQGIGIAPDALERIFQRFERGVSERHYGGLGLGLYLTRQSVEAMGGTVKAQGEPGRGAAFTVELPLFREEAWVERPKLHDLFAQVPIAVCILEGPQYTFTFANRAYLAMVGGRDVIGKPAKEALPELQGHGFDVLLGRVMATGEPFVGSELPV
ncbi:MAG TPA: ATP-binding protein, partial [Myxococcaceae bacterium]|nr:ATP-binding protein [Myxococcaceae bacterium]